MNRRLLLAPIALVVLAIVAALLMILAQDDDTPPTDGLLRGVSGEWTLTSALRSTGDNTVDECYYSPPPFQLDFEDNLVMQTEADGDTIEFTRSEPDSFIHETVSEGADLAFRLRIVSGERMELEVRSDFEGDILGCVYQLELVGE